MIQGWVVWATGGFPDKELPFYWGLGLLIVEHAEHNIIHHYWVEYNIFQMSCLHFINNGRQSFVLVHKILNATDFSMVELLVYFSFRCQIDTTI